MYNIYFLLKTNSVSKNAGSEELESRKTGSVTNLSLEENLFLLRTHSRSKNGTKRIKNSRGQTPAGYISKI